MTAIAIRKLTHTRTCERGSSSFVSTSPLKFVSTLRGEGRGHAGGYDFNAGVRAKLFWRVIYCAKMRPDPGYQYGSWSRRGLGTQDPRRMWEYGLVTAIAIRTLTHTRTCEKRSSSFVSTSPLKFVSTTREYFRSMPSTVRTNGEIFSLFMKVLTSFTFILLLPMSQDLIHWLLLVGVRVRVSKSDINYGANMSLP